MKTLDLTGFQKKSMVVSCEAGIYADAATGQRLIYDDEKKQYTPCTDKDKSKHVKKRTAKPYYTAVFTIEDANMMLHVLRSNEVNRHGLHWTAVFQCVISPKGKDREEGMETAEFWLLGDGNKTLNPDMLVNDALNEQLTAYVRASKYIDRVTKALGHVPTVEQLAGLYVTHTFDELANPIVDILHQRWGAEIEFTGISRRTAATIVARTLGANVNYIGGSYHEHQIRDRKGRVWRIVRDASVEPDSGDQLADNLDAYKCELITPICTYADMELLLDIIAQLKGKGMVANAGCGIHVHVDGSDHSAKTLKNLINIMAGREPILFRSLGVHKAREDRWCKPVDSFFLELVNGMKCDTLEQIKRLWYLGETSRSKAHYDNSRYHALNLHSLWQGKGIEFRMFNGSTEPDTIKAYILLALAINNQAKRQSRAVPETWSKSSNATKMRNWMNQMGMGGTEYETTRAILMQNFETNSTTRRSHVA